MTAGNSDTSRLPLQSDVIDQYDDAAAAIGRLTSVLETQLPLGAVLQQVCEQAVSAIAGADFAAVTLLEHGVGSTAACTDEVARDVDFDQYEAGQGPCLDAASQRATVRASRSDACDRWPLFAEKCAGSPINSFLSSPILSGGEVPAALNLYSYADHGFGTVDEAVLRVYVSCINIIVSSARTSAGIKSELDGLNIAMRSRAVIEQAKGVIMADKGVDADDAFVILTRRSQRENVKVSELAASIVSSVTPSRN
ncbi:GAF and ANTAR domain-containing protein [Rhodococcoides kyotonense]|uniref:GAF domain-containing protein n=1 Tax=Rhodococcoides kyotonense TaxID=398843 RepID=A0A239LJX5_9NOCA|nr:GAF and ANTAR domain-containing protein [Rhodococcus kyotonensis]SNT29959.1 GAF domain-containing protein [Rhodococcus kyotonensis]